MEAESVLHPIFLHDPEDWMQYLYKKVSIVTDNNEEHEGWVFTIDPVSQNIALVQFYDDRTQIFLIMHDSMLTKTVLADGDPTIRAKLDALFRPKSEDMVSEEELCSRKKMLTVWLRKNHLPVEETGPKQEILSVANALVINPPYEESSCHSINEIILGRIQSLVKNMPRDMSN